MNARDAHGRFAVSPLTQMHQARDVLKASVDILAHDVDRLRHDNAMARLQRELDHAEAGVQWADRQRGLYGARTAVAIAGVEWLGMDDQFDEVFRITIGGSAYRERADRTVSDIGHSRT